MMKKISIIISILLIVVVITGCEEKTNVVISNGKKVNTSKMEHKHCTRNGSGGTGITTELSYDIYYTDDVLNVLESVEKVVANKESDLDTYQEAYEKINEYYKDLEYYDTEVIRGDTSVTRTATINYDMIDIDKLLSIEGAEDNIIENGQAKVDLWLDLAKKFGTKCEKVEE